MLFDRAVGRTRNASKKNLINYKSEYKTDENGRRLRFKFTNGEFEKDGNGDDNMEATSDSEASAAGGGSFRIPESVESTGLNEPREKTAADLVFEDSKLLTKILGFLLDQDFPNAGVAPFPLIV